VFFGIVIGLMFWIGSRWHEVAPPVNAADDADVAGSAAKRSWLALAAIVLVIPAFPIALSQLQVPVDSFSVSLTAPQAKPGWAILEDAEFPYRPSFKGQRGEVFQRYRKDSGEALGLYIAYYAEQRKGAELVMHGNSLEGRQASGWIRTSAGKERLSIGTVPNATLHRGGRRLSLWSWYFINGRVVTNDFVAKGVLALNRVTGRKDDSAVLVLVVPADEGTAPGKEVAEDFIRDYMGTVEGMLRDVEVKR
jgi:EpsI family protein